MTQKIINLGTAANKGDGDVLRTAFGKVNDNFTEVYAAMGADVQIPSQATHNGKYLTTNGATLSWATVATGTTLPSQSGNEGKFLRTDSSTLSWVAITMPQDTGDLTNNEGFITEASELVNGTNTVGLDSLGNLLFTNGEQIKTNFLGGGLELYHSGDNSIGIYDGYARINTFTTGGAKHTWEFDDDGKLTVPGNISRSDPAGLTIGANYNVYIVADQTDNDVTWTFDGSTGSLTLPNLGTIANNSTGTSFSVTSTTVAPGANKEFLNGDVETVTTEFTATGGGIVGTATILSITPGGSETNIEFDQSFTASGPITFSSDIETTLELSPDGTTTWTFGTNGNLTFPDDTVQTTAWTGTAATATSTSTAASVGYIGMPQNSKSANYELVIGDMGKHVYVTATSTVTVPAYTSVNFPIGTTIAVVAGTGATVTIDITTDTMNLAGPGTTGTRTLAPFGMATLVKVAQSTWFISGVGLT